MKVLILVRHAKSSWDEPVSDFDRTLNSRGKEDAPKMAQRLLERKINVDAFISSPAKRARKTASLFIKEYGRSKEEIIMVPDLYHPAYEAFYEAIKQAPATAGTLAIFSHNPGVTEFANSLTNVRVDDMPTCAMFAIQADVGDWSQFRDAEKQFWFFDYPKAV